MAIPPSRLLKRLPRDWSASLPRSALAVDAAEQEPQEVVPFDWAREAARHLASSRHVVFRGQGHGVVVQDPCAARLRDAFIDDPEPKRALLCRADTPPNFTAAFERARNLSP